MTITLLPEQERLLREVMESGLATSPEEALSHALDLLKKKIDDEKPSSPESRAEAVRRLAQFREEHKLSLGNISIKELINSGRP
jgi:hypothetical protein